MEERLEEGGLWGLGSLGKTNGVVVRQRRALATGGSEGDESQRRKMEEERRKGMKMGSLA